MDNTDKLKEIRESVLNDKLVFDLYWHNTLKEKYRNKIKVNFIEEIQSETLDYGKQLGREETLKEIEKRLEALLPLPNNELGGKLGTIMLLIAKELKEQK